MNRDDVPCYTGSCPECGALLAMAVADATRPIVMEAALDARDEWKRDGLVFGITTVAAARATTLFAHKDDCSIGAAELVALGDQE